MVPNQRNTNDSKSNRKFRTLFQRAFGRKCGNELGTRSEGPKPALSHDRRKVPGGQVVKSGRLGKVGWRRLGDIDRCTIPLEQFARLLWQQKIELHLEVKPAQRRLIQTVRGVGYVLKES